MSLLCRFVFNKGFFMRHYFATQYTLPSLDILEGKRFCSYVLATDDTVKEILVKRNLGETLESKGMVPKLKNVMTKPTVIFDRINLTTSMEELNDCSHKLLHLVMFLLSVQEKKKDLDSIGGLFNDLGLVHQIYHCLIMQPVFLGNDFKVSVRMQLLQLEEKFPEMFLTEIEKGALIALKQRKEIELTEYSF